MSGAAGRPRPRLGKDQTFAFEQPIVEMTVMRPFRERSFMHNVRAAYADRCAMTGLRLIGQRGRPEVQAAHIPAGSVEGPDSVRGEFGPLRYVHWMFDRRLISVGDDYKILVAKDHVPNAARLLNPVALFICRMTGLSARMHSI